MPPALNAFAHLYSATGDVKLAALSEQAAAILELTRTERLFEIFETSSDAVRSFTYFLPNAMRAFPALSATPITPPATDPPGALAA